MSATLEYVDALVKIFTPTTTQFDAARSHRASISTRLDNDLGIYRIFETGSLNHGTAVKGFSDADYFVSLKGTRPQASTALGKVRDSLKGRFPQTNIRVSSPAVVCHFGNRSETVEVVPAYINTDGSYSIPDPATGGWMESNPANHLQYVTDANKLHDGDAKKMIRLLKAWKYMQSVPMSSFYLEMRGAKHAVDTSPFVIFWDMCLTLELMASRELAAMNDPTKTGPRFNPCSTETLRLDALSKTNTAALRARRAVTAYLAGKHDDAIDALRLLFGL